MYELRVFGAGARSPCHIETTVSAVEVMAVLPRLLREHADCDCIKVLSDQTPLFTVDQNGDRLS